MADEPARDHRADGAVERGGQRWRLGSTDTVEWMDMGRTIGLTITSAIAPVFEAYATLPYSDQALPPDFVVGMGELEVPFGRIFSDEDDEDVQDGAWLSDKWAGARVAAYRWQWQQRLVTTLTRFGSATWWLGYLDTGAAYLPFPDAPRIQMGPPD